MFSRSCMTWILLVGIAVPGIGRANPCPGLSGDAQRICKTVLAETDDGRVYVATDRSASQCGSATDGLPQALCYGLAGDSSRCQSSVPSYASAEKRDLCTAFTALGAKLTALDDSNPSCSSISVAAAKKFCEGVTEPNASDCSSAHDDEKASCAVVAKFFVSVWKDAGSGEIITEAEATKPVVIASVAPVVVDPIVASTDPDSATLESCDKQRCQATCDSGKPNASTIAGAMASATSFQCAVDELGVDQACLASSTKESRSYLAGVCSLAKGWGKPVIEDFASGSGGKFLTCTNALVPYYERYGFDALADGESLGDYTSFPGADYVVMIKN